MKNTLFTKKINVIILALLVSVLWGTLFPMIKIGYKAFAIDTSNVASIILFAGMRFFISGVILVSISAFRDKKLTFPKNTALPAILLVSLFTVVLHYVFTYTGMAFIESSKSSILKQTGFLVLPCFMFLFRKEDKFSLLKVTAALLGFCAVIVLNSKNMSFSLGIGEILIISASFISAAGQVISKQFYNRISPFEMVAWGQLLGGAFMLLIGFTCGGGVGKISISAIAVLAYMCAASIAANLIWNTLIKYNDMSTLAVLKSADPLFASVFSGILLAENILNVKFLIALLLIFSAIILSNLNLKKHTKTK